MKKCIQCKKKIRKNGYQVSIVRRTRSANVFKAAFFWNKVLTLFICSSCAKDRIRLESVFDQKERKQAMKFATYRDW